MLPASPALLSNSFFGDFAVLNVKLKNCIRRPLIKTWEKKKCGKIPASNDAKSLHQASQWAQNPSANIHRTPTAYKYHDEHAKDGTQSTEASTPQRDRQDANKPPPGDPSHQACCGLRTRGFLAPHTGVYWQMQQTRNKTEGPAEIEVGFTEK